MTDSDSINLEFYEYALDQNLNLNEFQNSEMSFRDTKQAFFEKMEFQNENLILYKSSEYALKYEVIIDSLTFSVYLNESISNEDLNQLKNDLENNFGKENIHFTSKEMATEIAKKEFGNNAVFFADDLFPASFDLKVINSPENKLKVENWVNQNQEKPEIEINSDSFESRGFIIKIKT